MYKLNNLPLPLSASKTQQRVLLMLFIFLPQEELLLVVAGFNRMCQVWMKYGAVTPNEIEFCSSIRHLGFIYFVKQFL